MHKSIWADKTDLPRYESLEGDIKTDVLIIGGGLCGILCGYLLTQQGIDCVIAEKNRIANGTTSNTTAKITFLHGLIYSDLIKKFGKEAAHKYLYANKSAIQKYEELCKVIPCDFLKSSAFTYSMNDKQKIEDEVKALESMGISAELKLDSPLPFSIAAAVCAKNQAQFNPLEFIKHISEDLTIYENTPVLSVTPNYAIFSKGKITAKNIIVATHFPFINKHGNYFLKLYQQRSYVLALENAAQIDGMYVDEAEGGLSFRNYKNYLLLGGCGGRTGKPCGNWDKLTEYKNKYYPHSEIKFKWATQDCISLDKIPYIGQYSPKTPNLYVATGFNKWGMTSSMVAATILCDMIQQKKCDYADVFSPSRSIITPQLFINGIETISNLIRPTTKRCSHLGCSLKWNKAEHTWDCACHGSRFDKNGSLINNPAAKDIDI